MYHVRRAFGCNLLLVLLLLVAARLLGAGLPASAEEEKAGSSTYTAEELAALDRALHAANMTPDDLTFRKDMAKGHECLPVVREMLHRPLTIAPRMDRFVESISGHEEQHGPAVEALIDALALLRLDAHEADGVREELADATAPEVLLERVAPMFDPLRLDAFEENDPALQLLRRELPEQMAWHDVFPSPFPADVDAALDARLEETDAAYVHEQASRLQTTAFVSAWLSRFGDPAKWLGRLSPDAFPTDAPRVRETPHGRFALGTPGNDRYEGDYAFLIDPGGDDHYVNCRIGAAYGTGNRRVGFFADLGGDDVYDCGDVDVTLGAAILGIAAFYDLGAGNDRYIGGHCSLGAAMGGVAVFYDDGGSDVYEGKTFTQGAAGFGIGIFMDDAVQDRPEVTSDEGTSDPVDIGLFDNDRLHAWANAQAFARCKGVALCINRRGNDVYEAGGVYLHAPLFGDRYQSFSQGFSIGQRGIDYAGGVAMLIDYEGNDRYLGDVYNQGVGYWYSAGLLWDGGGNDVYEMTQYGQGSGIHLAVGGLVDVSGHDTYVMHSGLGQGSSHDYAASILHDRGGNDRYLGNTSCNGAALTNSVGIHIDRSGNDVYAGRRKNSINFGRPARGFSSIGVLLDLSGQDDYLGIMADDSLWRHTDIGVGWDTVPEPEEEPADGATTDVSEVEEGPVVPGICSYEGDLTQEVFDELWGIAIRWEVGENRSIVPKARERLIAFGPDVLPYMDAVMEEGASGLELRAYVGILRGLRETGREEDVVAFLRKNLVHEVERRRRVALYLTGELKAGALEGGVVRVLEGDDEVMARRAAGALEQIGSHAGDETLRRWLGAQDDELGLRAALGTLMGLESDVWADVRGLLDHPLLSVRTHLAALLVKHSATYLDCVRVDLAASDLSDRARRTILDVLVRLVPAPDAAEVKFITVLLEHPDWGVRADAVRLLRRWEADEVIDRQIIAPALERLETLLVGETDPYVLFCAGGE